MPIELEHLETPAMVIREAVVLENIRRFQAHCDRVGLAFRPHIKTHKSIRMAKAQLEAGAVGINCQKIGEAEVMAGAGIEDILITYNIIGPEKLARLRALGEKIARLSVTADNVEVVHGLSGAFADAERPLTVLVECDTGGARCGVQNPQAAVDLAEKIAASPNLTFGGLMTYPAKGGQDNVVAFMTAAVAALEGRGLSCPVVTSGGTPDMWTAAPEGVLTEYRAGTYIYNDRSLVAYGTCSYDDCAAVVVATVVSTPAPGRAVIDAGSKALTSDLLGLEGHGHILGHPDAQITGLSEEHGIVSYDAPDAFRIGERLRIVPNHVCVVSNLFDSVWLERADGAGLEPMPIDARGKVT